VVAKWRIFRVYSNGKSRKRGKMKKKIHRNKKVHYVAAEICQTATIVWFLRKTRSLKLSAAQLSRDLSMCSSCMIYWMTPSMNPAKERGIMGDWRRINQNICDRKRLIRYDPESHLEGPRKTKIKCWYPTLLQGYRPILQDVFSSKRLPDETFLVFPWQLHTQFITSFICCQTLILLGLLDYCTWNR
jgi:hypothetical protein